MTVAEFVGFVRKVSMAAGRVARITSRTAISILSSVEIVKYVHVWGVMKKARDFAFLHLDCPDHRISKVQNALMSHGLGCTFKRQTFGACMVAFFVFANGSELGHRVAETLSKSPDGSTRCVARTEAELELGRALGYPCPMNSKESPHKVASMYWTVSGSGLLNYLFSSNVVKDCDPQALLEQQDAWTDAMALLHPDLECKLVITNAP
jgi:hypothetical protein